MDGKHASVLVLGSGGRAHSLWWALMNGTHPNRRVFCAPGNGGIPSEWRRQVNLCNQEAVLELCRKERIDLVVIGPEQPLIDGLTDFLQFHGVRVFGPSQAAAQHEADKTITRKLCTEMGIPQPHYRVVTSTSAACRCIDEYGVPVAVKGPGPRAGKGVHVCKTHEEAYEAAGTELGQPANMGKLIIEQCLDGEEASIMAICDGEDAFVLMAGDKKRRFDGDQGPNTGSMGSYSPVPWVDEVKTAEYRHTFILPMLRAMKHRGMPFTGVLYAGIMETVDGPKLLEYNVRFGDSECQALIVRLLSGPYPTDIFPHLWAAGEYGGFEKHKAPVLWVDSRVADCVNLISDGYPGAYEKGKLITGIEDAEALSDVTVFHAGTEVGEDGKLYSAGGRVLNVVALGDTFEEARKRAYEAVALIRFENKAFRTDIGVF